MTTDVYQGNTFLGRQVRTPPRRDGDQGPNGGYAAAASGVKTWLRARKCLPTITISFDRLHRRARKNSALYLRRGIQIRRRQLRRTPGRTKVLNRVHPSAAKSPIHRTRSCSGKAGDEVLARWAKVGKGVSAKICLTADGVFVAYKKNPIPMAIHLRIPISKTARPERAADTASLCA